MWHLEISLILTQTLYILHLARYVYLEKLRGPTDIRKISSIKCSDAGRCNLKVARLVAFPRLKIVTSYATVTAPVKSS